MWHILCAFVCVRLEVVSSHLPAVMLWLASSLQACCQQEVSSAQCSHQHTAGSVLTADINGHTFTHTNVLKNAQNHTLHSAITRLSHVCAYFSISQSPCYANKRVENVAEWECGSNGRLSSPRASVFSLTSPTSYTLNFNLSWQTFNSLRSFNTRLAIANRKFLFIYRIHPPSSLGKNASLSYMACCKFFWHAICVLIWGLAATVELLYSIVAEC